MIAAKRLRTALLPIRSLADSVRSERAREFRLIALFTVLNLPLGLVLYQSGALGVVHSLVCFAVGIYWAVNKNVKLERIALVCAYIIGAEVLWRMAETPIFWEFGKYAPAAIMIVALVQRGHFNFPLLPVGYLFLLLPASFLTVLNHGAVDARGMLSFNMSGPFFLFISAWFFSHLRLNYLQVRRILLAIVIPLLGVACTTLFYTVTTENIQFTEESNFATSGGFGPNQVSSMLGFGALAALAGLVLFKNDVKLKIYFGVACLLLTAQSVMTFSRSGIYNAVGAAAILIFFQLKNQKDAVRRLLPIAGVVVLFVFIVFPFMNEFTGGKLQERFEDTGTSHRGEIIQSDFAIMMENPLFGVGVGEAHKYRQKFLYAGAASHTEFSRLISEHGVFGILALLSLVLMTVLNIKYQDSGIGKGFVACFVVWSGLFMSNAGMRLAAPSFAWGLSFAMIANLVSLRRERRNRLRASRDDERRELLIREPRAHSEND